VKEVFKIKDLDQVRLLSDPLKLRLLQTFAESAKTVKQAAAELGENVTKLYRHVDALLDAGMLVVIEEKQKRGTVQRTLRAVAQRFEADHALFADEHGAAGTEAVREMLRISEEEILNVLAHTGDDVEEELAILMRVRGSASPEKIAELRETLKAWLDSIPAGDQAPEHETVEFGGLIAFYQID